MTEEANVRLAAMGHTLELLQMEAAAMGQPDLAYILEMARLQALLSQGLVRITPRIRRVYWVRNRSAAQAG